MWIISVLARPGTPIKQAVAAGEDRDQELFEHRVLADDHLGHLGLQLGERVLQALDGRDVVFILQGPLSGWCRSHALLSYLDLDAQRPDALDVARIAPRGSSLNVTSEIVVGNTNRSISAPSVRRRTITGIVTRVAVFRNRPHLG